MNRRKFVQFCLGAAAAGTTAATAFSLVKPLAIPRAALGAPIPYIGAERVAGPAPRGVPLIPIFLNENGFFEVKPILRAPDFDVGLAPVTAEVDGEEVEVINTLDWMKYCGHAGAPGLSLAYGNDENELKFFIAEEKIAQVKPWYENLLGKRMKPNDFPDVEFGAGCVFRSEGQSGPNVITASLMRFPEGAIQHVNAIAVPPAKPIPEEQVFNWIVEEFMHTHEDGSIFACASTYCTHFCCIPGYKEAEALARPRGAWDQMFCTCHNSAYDARRPVTYIFYPEPAEEAEDGEGGGGGGGGH